MTSNPETMCCAEFQAQLPDLIASGAEAAAHPHLKSCEACRGLLADLETVAEAARRLFPGVEPPEQVWEQIESAIEKEEREKDGKAGREGAASLTKS